MPFYMYDDAPSHVMKLDVGSSGTSIILISKAIQDIMTLLNYQENVYQVKVKHNHITNKLSWLQ